MASLIILSEEEKALSLNHDIAELDQRASQLYRGGDYATAVDLLRRAYQMREKVLGAHHVDTLMNLNNLAAGLGRLGLLEEAEEAFRDTLVGRMKVRGKKHGDTFTTMNHLGVLLKQLGQFEEAEALLYTAFEGFRSLHGIEHICTAEVAFSYGVLAVQQGKRNKAAYMFSVSVLGLTRALGSTHQHTRDAVAWEAICRATHAQARERAKQAEATGAGVLSGGVSAAQRNRNKGGKSAPQGQPGVIPPAQAPLPTVFEVEEMDYVEGIYAAKKDWKKRKECMICETRYTMTRREHHCRICAGSICFDCSEAETFVMEFAISSPVPGANKLPSKQRCCSNCEAQGFV